MKRLFTYLLVLLAVAACGSRGGEEDTRPMNEREWSKADVMDLEMQPVSAFAKDWMALGVRTKEGINAMTISWGSIGELWGKPVLTVYVSRDRHTKGMMDESAYFTVSAFPQDRRSKDALLYIGSHSLKDEPDKLEKAGLTAELSELGNPLFREACLAFECKILYREEFKRDQLPEEVRSLYEEMGLHTMYVGEIINFYKK